MKLKLVFKRFRLKLNIKTKSALQSTQHEAANGHHLPLAVTFGFLTLGGCKRPLYGNELGTRFGSTRPEADFLGAIANGDFRRIPSFMYVSATDG